MGSEMSDSAKCNRRWMKPAVTTTTEKSADWKEMLAAEWRESPGAFYAVK